MYRLFFPNQTEKNRMLLRDVPAMKEPPDQAHAICRRLRYGVKPMSYNGCEVIACCHIQQYFRGEFDLCGTAAFCAEAGLWLFGIFGTYPHSLYRFCRVHGFSCRRYTVGKNEDAAEEEAFLYSYWNPRFRGIHTVAVYRDRESGLYIVKNHRVLRNRLFPTAAAALRAISTACPILCLGIRNA